LVFTVQPVTTVADRQITPAVKVTALDALGNSVPSFTGTVTMALVAGNGAVLGGTTAVAAVNGVATFGTLFIDKTGTGYTLTASTSGLPAVTSTAFNITPAPASVLAFTVQPTTTLAGATITPPVQVSAQDPFGNLVPTFVGNVTVAIGAGTGTPGATLGGTTTAAAVGGVATFATVS